MNSAIAIVGMACQYPDAHSPVELWENILAQRQAFRQLPPERLNLSDYFSPEPTTPDRTYITQAAVIEGYEFDRVGFCVPNSTFNSTDLTHWLALDIAAKALSDAGFLNGEDLPHERTGVLVGNTLTGEFSRANVMRLRWQYVRRIVEAELIKQDWTTEQRDRFLTRLETQYKAPFPEVGEETLAGGLSNTIAGRICNYFNLKGGGYTLDGACSSSLLAVAHACSALVAGDLDVAIAGGVDLSLDPFELVGFAKTGALTPDKMRIYDTHSAGFLPGEGCGFVVLMRYEDAIAQSRRIYATIRGWGISSDGSGGITRPEVEGQLLALQRAYRKADFNPHTVAYFEGHGTGTSVGDTTELKALSRAIQESKRDSTHSPWVRSSVVGCFSAGEGREGGEDWEDWEVFSPPTPPTPSTPPTDFDHTHSPFPTPAAIGSIKANIGHTKAAAGIAGLIKATMAVYSQIIPPTTGCEHPHPELTRENPALRVLKQSEPWHSNYPLRAGVSAMGFGGINAHIVLEGVISSPDCKAEGRGQRAEGKAQECKDIPWNVSTLSSAQDAELLLLGATNTENLQQQINHLLTLTPKLSYAEVSDLATQLAKTLQHSFIRVAIVASSPQELTTRLETLNSWLQQGVTHRLDRKLGLFLGAGTTPPRIGFLFPGQASPTYLTGGIWRRRFSWVQQLYEQANLPVGEDSTNTAIAQPAIVTASIAGLQTLDNFGINGTIAVGQSLGELCALHWGKAFDTATLLRIAKVRGKAMAELGHPSGTMASIRADRATVTALLTGKQVAIAGFNSPRQTVISGEAHAVTTVIHRAHHQGLKATTLPVSHAFHSPLVAAATEPLAKHLATETLHPLQRPVVSTVTGTVITPDTDLRSLLCSQITSPVRFIDAVTQASQTVDLWIEVGPGQVLSGLVSDFVKTPIFPLDAGGSSLKELLQTVGVAFALGTPINANALFSERYTKPFNLNWQPRFFTNPCEHYNRRGDARSSSYRENPPTNRPIHTPTTSPPTLSEQGEGSISPTPALHTGSVLDIVRQLVAQRAELPVTAIKNNSHLLSDLHLNSITVSQLVAEASRHLNLSPPTAPTDYANATIAEVVQALEELASTGNSQFVKNDKQLPSGVDAWIRTFTVELVEHPLPRRIPPSTSTKGEWQVFAPSDYPFALSLQEAFNQWGGGGGVIICLPPNPDERHLNLLLSGAKAVLAQNQSEFDNSQENLSPNPSPTRRGEQNLDDFIVPPSPLRRGGLGGRGLSRQNQATRFILVQQEGGGAAFVRTLQQETPNLTTCVINLPVDLGKDAWNLSTDWVLAEAKAAVGYVEAHYNTSGVRYEPVLRLLTLPDQTSKIKHLNSDDLLLVTGGGKGIAAESALSLAKETGIRLALLGRSNPDTDAELAANLQRLTAAGIQFHYIATDVTDGSALREAIAKIEAELGTITAILHGAGTNVPKLLTSLDEKALHRTLAPKVQGLRNVLAAVNPHQLKLLVTFGSIIARTGLPGEADYALANEWLSHLTEDFGKQYPNCHCLTVEWSVWSGVGMGERLGRIDTLMQQGITPIPPDTGVAILHNLITQCLETQQLIPNSVVVTGRFGEAPTLKLEKPELPFRRFLERPRVYIPGVELVVDVELSSDTDPYLKDHQVQGEQLLPAVIGLEAMAQVAMAVAGTELLPAFQDVKFNRPVVVPNKTPLTIRIAALVRNSNQVEVVLRSEQTAFGLDHFQGICQFNRTADLTPHSPFPIPHSPLLINPQRDLYSSILFHQGRFQRLRNYRKLQAKECCAEIESNTQTNWFGRYLPSKLVLGDPGARDALIHAIQACIPHATLLPIGVEQLVLSSAPSTDTWFLHATERVQHGDTFIYDLEVIGTEGQLLERWQGLQLRRVNPVIPDTWAVPLLIPYIERRVKELIPEAKLGVAVVQDTTVERRVRSDRAIHQALGSTISVSRRPDGKPEVANGQAISVAHAGDITIACAGLNPIGCDIEPVVPRTATVWQDLLLTERFALAGVIAQETTETLDIAATRIWSASECLKKAGAMVNAPLVLVESTADGVIVLASGESAIVSFVVSVRDVEPPLVFGVLVKKMPKKNLVQ